MKAKVIDKILNDVLKDLDRASGLTYIDDELADKNIKVAISKVNTLLTIINLEANS